jgi:hypothetical protein
MAGVTKRHVGLLLALAAVLAVLLPLLCGLPRPFQGDPGPRAAEERLRELRQRIELETAEADAAVESYRPSHVGRIDDLAVSVEDVLRGLPGVAALERRIGPPKPACRIIHLRDRPLVPKDLFAIDVRQAAGGPPDDGEVERMYRQHLLETELVQIEQMVLLRCLARSHGLRTVRIEGLTASEVTWFRKWVDMLKGLEKEAEAARVQLRGVRKLMRDMEAAGKKDSDRYYQAAGIERELLVVIGQHWPHLLEVGAAGRLLLAGDIAEVLALNDERLLALAKPITPDGSVHFDADKVGQREDAQVQAALDGGPFALIVLGGAHDLSDSIRRVAGGDCEYIRVTTKAYQEFEP